MITSILFCALFIAPLGKAVSGLSVTGYDGLALLFVATLAFVDPVIPDKHRLLKNKRTGGIVVIAQ